MKVTRVFPLACLAVILGLICPPRSLSAGADSFNEDSWELSRFFTNLPRNVAVSVDFVRLRDGHSLYSLNPDTLVCPASVTKLVTGAAALAKFGAGPIAKTRFFYTGTRREGTINGDLVVVGDGDPFLVSEKMWQVAADLKNMGVKEFTGGIIVDNSLFDEESRDASREDGRKASSHAYDAPISSFAINFNTLSVAASPGKRVGDPALVTLDPFPIKGVALDNQVRTVAGASANIHATRVSGNRSETRIAVAGSVGLQSPTRKIYRSVENYLLVSGELTRAFLDQVGIKVRGPVSAGRLTSDMRLLTEMESYPLQRIIEGLDKFSNNFIADMLVKRLGSKFPASGEPDQRGSGTMAAGLRVVQDFLRRDVGLRGDFVFENGSGLAAENRLTARQITSLLAYMERRMDLFPEFISSLPSSAVDGTLEKRFDGKNSSARGMIRAKTGTLTEPITVATLAGYFRSPKQGLVAFAVLENGKPGASQPSLSVLHDHQDGLLEFVSKK